ncbi:GNAT family N-acetyltransferase [Spirosoma sp. BT702]|uniref:GNAT family N-acetyltransferase n=1 Tax=Spirosoma profusum TaxID=2771354 RepID=A0A926Y2E0_9BACT|nr:GNAT family N-acetyltransferase [Spirosoma profusum]MBD2700701.1 GNAT family N-acetyltransferase [Spirosoma profusum]
MNVAVLNVVTSRGVIAGGPVAKDNNKEIINGLLAKHKEVNVKTLYSQVRNLHDTLAYKEAFQRNNFTYEEHLNFIIDLRKTEDVLWKKIYSKRRNEIRRALNEGCTIHLETSLDSLKSAYAILKEVYQRARLPLPGFEHFSALHEQTSETAGLRLFTAKWEGKIIGCMLCLAHNGTLYDYYAGAYSKFYNKYPNDLLPWEIMKWAKNNGFTQFDFGGAGKPDVHYGVREYKKKFGGQLVNYGRYERIELPVLYTVASVGFRLIRALGNVSFTVN